jgi:glycosyltransferase involved in cell wall biosynthesis
MHERPSIAVFLDSPDERWLSMDLVGEMLLREWTTTLAAGVEASAYTVGFPRVARRFRRLAGSPTALRLDTVAGRFLVYPARAAMERGSHDFFHVVDHSYAQLVHVLPRGRAGVFCHDLDTFRSLLEPEKEPRPAWFRAMQRVTLLGLRSARVVFYSTRSIREEIERHGIVPSSRLVQAPYGIAEEFTTDASRDAATIERFGEIGGRPFLLHVGSEIRRKRLDVLFDTFARLKDGHPDLLLVQAGASLTDAQRAHVEALGIGDRLVLLGKLPRPPLAALYRRAKAVLMPSELEGFGMPVIEALACGAPVFASDIPVFREVGAGCVVHCRLADPEDWAATLGRFLEGKLAAPPVGERLALAAKYSWTNHARVILEAYRALER